MEGVKTPDSEMRRWYVVYSKPHKEETALFHLRLKGFEAFLPLLAFPECLRRRRQIVPLFPGYLFVRINVAKDYHSVVWSPGVKRLVSFNGTPASLDEETVTFMMQRVTSEGVLTARSNLTVGERVEMTGGPFDGIVGIIREPPNAKGRVKLLMKLLSRQINVEVPVRFVKSGWVA